MSKELLSEFPNFKELSPKYGLSHTIRRNNSWGGKMNPQIDLDFIKQDFYRKKLKDFLEILFESSIKKSLKGVLLFGSLARGEANNDKL